MPFIPEPGKGRLFDNRIDRKNEKQPDYTGSASCPCCTNMIRLSGWYNPPSERSRVATIGLQLQDYREYQDEVAKRKAAKANKGHDPRDHAPAIQPEDDQPGTYPDDGAPAPYDDDIPF